MIYTCCSDIHIDSETSLLTCSRMRSTSILLKQWFKNTRRAVCSFNEPSCRHASRTCWKNPGKCSGLFLNACKQHERTWNIWVRAILSDKKTLLSYLPDWYTFTKLFIQHNNNGHHVSMWGISSDIVWPQKVFKALAELQHHCPPNRKARKTRPKDMTHQKNESTHCSKPNRLYHIFTQLMQKKKKAME